MAAIQEFCKWIVTLLLVLAIFVAQPTICCHPASKKLHICLNIYLERDFNLIETIVKGSTREHKPILEGPYLDKICTHIAELEACYSDLLPQCNTLWQYDRYMRLMDVLGATRNFLCGDGTANVRDVLYNSSCLVWARSHLAGCKGFDWAMSWKEVLRMQVSPQDRCREIQTYRNCLINRLIDLECSKSTADIYKRLIDVWLKHWCAMDLSEIEEKKYFYLPVVEKSPRPTTS